MLSVTDPNNEYLRLYHRFSKQPQRIFGPIRSQDIGTPNHADEFDLACFILWEGALGQSDAIIGDIGQNFEIAGLFEVEWSQKHYENNVARLYHRPCYNRAFNGFHRKIGKPPFIMAIAKDRHPNYGWWRSVSGAIELTNLNVVQAKARYRSLFEERYVVHSSANTAESLAQISLILGPEYLTRMLKDENRIEESVKKDLEGAEGWKDWDAFFSVMQHCGEFVMLRGFEQMPLKHEGADIDFLCSNLQGFASSANVTQREDRPYKGTLEIAGDLIPVDIRFTGDGYYPVTWERDILAARVFDGSQFVPSPDHYFFSLLYHATVQKKEIKPAYKVRLAQLASALKFEWFDAALLDSPNDVRKILAGFMSSNGYTIEMPIDPGVYQNQLYLGGLPTRNIQRKRSKKGLFGRLSSSISKRLKR